MKLEVGKSYRTRDGRKAEVIAHDPTVAQPFVGKIQGASCWRSWNEDGTFYHSPSIHNYDLDLLSEWVEPEPKKPRLLAYINNSGMLMFLYENEEVVQLSTWTQALWLDQPEEK